jgi:pSer/pThr/pTyr-binding forkhead associated (FHA) protein
VARLAKQAVAGLAEPAARWPELPFPAGRERLFTIGRDGGCDLVLADVTVSRRHARLERNGAGWLLQDLGSTNGTRLNGWLVSSPVPVRAGDQVSFGAASFMLADGS